MNITDFYTIMEAAQAMRKTTTWVRALCKRDELPGVVKKGKIWFIPKSSVIDYINQGRRPGNPQFSARKNMILERCEDFNLN